MKELIELSGDNFQETLKGQKLAVVDYYASWCGACRMATPMFKRVAADLNEIPFYKIDAEKFPHTREGVQIANLPTVAVFKDGNFVASLSTTKEESLREFLRENGASL